jgi:hypothetical protein
MFSRVLRNVKVTDEDIAIKIKIIKYLIVLFNRLGLSSLGVIVGRFYLSRSGR